MAIPTRRSVLKFRFNFDATIFDETSSYIDHRRKEHPTGNSCFSRPAQNQLKWEVSEPGFGYFYRVSFKIRKKA